VETSETTSTYQASCPLCCIRVNCNSEQLIGKLLHKPSSLQEVLSATPPPEPRPAVFSKIDLPKLQRREQRAIEVSC
jgi:hypothetical protein